MKTCARCGESKPTTAYGVHKRTLDGLDTTCLACKRLTSREWHLANRERALRYARDYKAARPEHFRELKRVRRESNPGLLARERRSYYERNREKFLDYEVNRRAWKLAGFVENIERRVVFDRDGGVCGICHRPVTWEEFSVDHIFPLRHGGEHSYGNTQSAHLRCNMSKGARLPQEASS